MTASSPAVVGGSPSAPSAALADFAAALSFEDIPEDVLAKARMHLLDFVGVSLAGSRVPEVVSITDLTCSRGAHPVATVIGADQRTSVTDAAYVNGCASDVLEHQDGYRFGGFHPSHALPALLAVAEAEDRSIADLLTSIVVAYEIANRIGRAVHPKATIAGWFPTAAGYGAAAGCANLLAFDADLITSAFGTCGFFVPAVMIEAIFSGCTVKPAFGGQLARSAVEAVQHVQAGLVGWAEVLESRHGYVDLLADLSDIASLADGLGTEWTIHDVHLKRYAGCRHTHGAAQACIAIAAKHQLDPRHVTDIDVETYDVARALVGRPMGHHDSAIRCTLNLPYVAAVGLVDGEVSAPQYAVDRISDELVKAVASKVRIRVAEDLEARYPEFTATRVTISTSDGLKVQEQVDIPMGDTRAPLTPGDLLDKFRGAARSTVGDEATRRIEGIVLNSHADHAVRDLTAAVQL
jgi:2-methylcitrate dehydratase PrpD